MYLFPSIYTSEKVLLRISLIRDRKNEKCGRGGLGLGLNSDTRKCKTFSLLS